MASYKDTVELARVVAIKALMGVAKSWEDIPRDATHACVAILEEAARIGLTDAKAALAEVLEMDAEDAKRLLES